MADTARAEGDDTTEIFDNPETLEWKVALLARWFREAQHAIAFTGAGISTSAGVPDFRSGLSTSLKTGPGVWALRASGTDRSLSQKLNTVSTIAAVPTPTHMSLVALLDNGLLKHIVSQNTDGLHVRSGVSTDDISELHGNSTVEVCGREQKHAKEQPHAEGCGRAVARDFRVRRQGNRNTQHETGRSCPVCNGPLFDTTVNFGESLQEDTLATAYAHADRSDLCLALGSSLTVAPASGIPGAVAGGEDYRQQRAAGHTGGGRRRLVIVNLQRTPLDDIAALRINAKTDTVMKMLMSRLALEVPVWSLQRRLRVGNSPVENGAVEVFIEGLAADGIPHQVCRRLVVQRPVNAPLCISDEMKENERKTGIGGCRITDKGNVLVTVDERERASAKLAVGLCGLADGHRLSMKAIFYGRYGEPSLDIEHEILYTGTSRVLHLLLNLEDCSWTVHEMEELEHQQGEENTR